MSAEEKVKAFIEVLKIVAWPAIVGWIIWYLRDEIKRAGSRIIELGPAGARFAPPPEQVPTQPTTGVSAAVQPASTLTTGRRLPQTSPHRLSS